MNELVDKHSRPLNYLRISLLIDVITGVLIVCQKRYLIIIINF